MKPEQITAWALDEASPEERLQLEAELRESPTAQKGAEETKAFCDFLLAELRDESLELTAEQRERLQATPMPAGPVAVPGGDETKKNAAKPQLRWRAGTFVRAALAACLVLGSLWAWQEYGRRTRRGEAQVAEATEIRYKVLSPPLGASLDQAPHSNLPISAEKVMKAPSGNGAIVAGLPVVPLPEARPQMRARLSDDGTTLKVNGALAVSSTALTPGDVSRLKALEDQQTYGLGNGAAASTPGLVNGVTPSVGNLSQPTTAVVREFDYSGPMEPPQLTNSGSMSAAGVVKAGSGSLVLSGASTSTGGVVVAGSTGVAGAGTVLGDGSNPNGSKLAMAGASAVPAASSPPAQALPGGGMTNTAASLTVNALPGSAAAPASPPVPPLQAAAGGRGEGYVTVAGNPTPLVADPMPDAPYFGNQGYDNRGIINRTASGVIESRRQSFNESYQRIVENELKDVAREPLSTFSIDVDTAAYANVRRFLNQNMVPPADAVRIEELINYFPAAEEGPAPGAKEPFAVRVEMAPCPWQPVHRLARIAIKGRELGNERKASNLVFLVDVSGSMDEPSKLPLVQQSLRMLTDQLREEDRVTMVVYAGSSGMVLPPTSGDKKTEILAAIDKLRAGGSTHGSAGIQLAYEQAVAGFIKEGVNRVILCTDGDFNVGISSPEELEKLITKKAKSGVFLSVLGFGTGNLKDRTMETLADKGNGNYAYIDSLGEARKVLVDQMSGTLVTIAKDVKIQVEFNPAMVRSYRLVGYENRLLKKEDFNDDTKDAGEIGAGHSVVALYEVVPTNLPPGAEPRPAVDGLRYQQAPAALPPAQLAEAAKSGEVMTVKLRYKEPDSSLSKLIEVPAKDEGKTLTASTEEFKFSAAVAGFGLLLRGSAYKGALGWETVRKLALDGKGADKMGYRGEFLQLIDKARGLKETQP